MKVVGANVEPADHKKIREMTEFDGFNFSAFVRAKVRERYAEYVKRRKKA
ncbi:MAG: hypothetical protein ACYDBK_02485 [Thermoplasmataceae archaeon]